MEKVLAQADAPFPFTTDFEFDPRSTSFRVAIAGSDGTPGVNQAIEVLATFLAAVKCGMYSRSAKQPLGDEVQELVSPGAVPAGQLHRDYLIRGVDVSALRVLVNLLCQVPHAPGKTFGVLLRSAEAGAARRYYLEDMASLPYQAWPEETPFEVNCPWPDDITFNPVIRFGLVRALAEEETRLLERAIGIWGDIVRTGGYMEEPARAEGPYFQSMESYPVSPLLWEVPLHRFGADESSFAPLIRFAIRFHCQRCPLSTLEIQP